MPQFTAVLLRAEDEDNRDVQHRVIAAMVAGDNVDEAAESALVQVAETYAEHPKDWTILAVFQGHHQPVYGFEIVR